MAIEDQPQNTAAYTACNKLFKPELHHNNTFARCAPILKFPVIWPSAPLWGPFDLSVISVLVIGPDIGFILDDNPDSDGQIVDSDFLPHLQLNYAYCLGRTASALFRNSDVPTDAHRTESLESV